ncbi:MAG: copper resistance protein CopC [Bacillati bacterium ANGP1]|uniref:Copper resistance protein CopC n=1 Tax=Candidatus Segetimicrobium genomatis TaxID=2569760 RepID=A0A537J0E3_9BACT|nr:MAG: copper resistance protein CopC [Terrabacteria group bacterium ANGP1]
MWSRRREPRLDAMRISDGSLPPPASHLSEIRSRFPRARSTEMAIAAPMAPQDTFGSWSTDGLTALSSAMCPLTEIRSSSSSVCSMQILTLLTLTVVLAVPAGLWAHATLVRSEPKAGAVLTGPPTVVRAWFDDELDPDRSTIGVWDVREHRVDDGGGGVDLSDLDRKSMMARLRAVGAGTYTVRWRAVSADDGFVAQGSFAFAVKR